MPLSERARVEVYLPDLPRATYQDLLAALTREFTHTFGGCTIISGLDGSYLSPAGLHIQDLHYGSEVVVEDFLRQSNSIHFVLLVFVEILYDPYPRRAGCKVATELYMNQKLRALSDELRDRLNSLDQFFPIPEIDVNSALSNIKRRQFVGSDSNSLTFPSQDDCLSDDSPVEPVIRKWSNPIKRRVVRNYSTKLVTDVRPTKAERHEADQEIANGAQGVDDVENILAPLALCRRVLEIHPGMAADINSGKIDILYDPFTFQVIAAFRSIST